MKLNNRVLLNTILICHSSGILNTDNRLVAVQRVLSIIIFNRPMYKYKYQIIQQNHSHII